MYNVQLIEERIMSIANKMGLSKNKLLINAHLGKSFFDNMKKGQVPSVEKLHMMADYLNVSIDYLVGRTDEQNIHHSNNVSSSFVQNDSAVTLGSVSVTSAFHNNSSDISSSKEETEILNIYRSLDARDRTKFMNFVFEMEDKATKA